jgi:glutamate synthase (NADPH/NADH) small chain
MPEWQDLLYKDKWREAFHVLEQTSDFPEFTGRICPALCEKSCVLNLSCGEPVTIREDEVAIAEMAFREGYVTPYVPTRNGKRVAVIGSGPAGLAAANRLNRKGYEVTVYEKMELPGGLLRYGIPNFKLSKHVIDRRVALMEQEGVRFVCGANIGAEISAKSIVDEYDAVCVAIGSETPRDLPIEGREYKGIHFALDLLSQQNRQLEGIDIPKDERIDCKGKRVLVIGGGDTGSDCVGTARRQGATVITQIEIMPKPPVGTNPATPWPMYPIVLKTSSSHEEGCERYWSLTSNKFISDDKGNLRGVEVEEVEWATPEDGGRPQMVKTGRIRVIDCDLVFLALGFVHPVQEGLIAELGLPVDARQNIAVKAQQVGNTKIFAAGDAATGASLVVKAIAGGQRAAKAIDAYLSK